MTENGRASVKSLTRRSPGRSLPLTVMHGQPNRRLVGRRPFDSVPPVRRDGDEIAGLHVHEAVVETEPRGALQNEHPFGLILVVPESTRRGVAVRDDPFNADVGGGE